MQKNELMLEYALDKIQALLDAGKITEEAANSMVESFVNQYITEGNNDLIINEATRQAKEIHKASKQYTRAFEDWNANTGGRFKSKSNNEEDLQKEMDDNYKALAKSGDKLYKLGAGVNDLHQPSDSLGFGKRYGEKLRVDEEIKKYKRSRGYKFNPSSNLQDAMVRMAETSNNHSEYKNPRDGYYMKSFVTKNTNRLAKEKNQKNIKESFDEIQLGLYEAADAGLLNPEFIPVMIEAVEFYLES